MAANDGSLAHCPRLCCIDNPFRKVSAVEERTPMVFGRSRQYRFTGFVGEIAEMCAIRGGNRRSDIGVGSFARTYTSKEVLHMIKRSVPFGLARCFRRGAEISLGSGISLGE